MKFEFENHRPSNLTFSTNESARKGTGYEFVVVSKCIEYMSVRVDER